MKKFNVEIKGMDKDTTEWCNVWDSAWYEEPFEAENEAEAIELARDYFVANLGDRDFSLLDDGSVIVEYYELVDESNDLFTLNSVNYIFRATEITE